MKTRQMGKNSRNTSTQLQWELGNFMLDSVNFYLIRFGILITCLLEIVWIL